MEQSEIRKQAEKFVEPGFKLVTKTKVREGHATHAAAARWQPPRLPSHVVLAGCGASCAASAQRHHPRACPPATASNGAACNAVRPQVDKKLQGGFVLEFEDRLVDLSTAKKQSEFNKCVGRSGRGACGTCPLRAAAACGVPCVLPCMHRAASCVRALPASSLPTAAWSKSWRTT